MAHSGPCYAARVDWIVMPVGRLMGLYDLRSQTIYYRGQPHDNYDVFTIPAGDTAGQVTLKKVSLPADAEKMQRLKRLDMNMANRRNIVITQTHAKGYVLQRWTLHDACPIHISKCTSASDGSHGIIKKVRLVYDRLTVENR